MVHGHGALNRLGSPSWYGARGASRVCKCGPGQSGFHVWAAKPCFWLGFGRFGRLWRLWRAYFWTVWRGLHVPKMAAKRGKWPLCLFHFVRTLDTAIFGCGRCLQQHSASVEKWRRFRKSHDPQWVIPEGFSGQKGSSRLLDPAPWLQLVGDCS